MADIRHSAPVTGDILKNDGIAESAARRRKLLTAVYFLLISAVMIGLCSRCSPLYPFNNWNDANCFFTTGKAMFSGKSEDIVVPYAAMTALIAKEYDFGIPLGQALEAFDMSEGVAKQLSEELEDDDDETGDGPDFSEEDGAEDADGGDEVEDDEEPEGDSAGFEFVKDDDDK